MANINRRLFLSGASATTATGAVGALGALGNMQAHAADTSGYKALICIFLAGGIDHCEQIMPYDQQSLDQLRGLRRELYSNYDQRAPRRRDRLHKINPDNIDQYGGREFAMPPEMPFLAELFNNGELALVSNVGQLIVPTTRQQYDQKAVPLPRRLFSHNDQTSVALTGAVEGNGKTGWGGRMADFAAAAGSDDAAKFATIATSDADLFLRGNNVRPFFIGTNDLPKASGSSMENDTFRLGALDGADEARRKFGQYLAGNGLNPTNVFMQDYIAANSRSLSSTATLADAIQNASQATGNFPNYPEAKQLANIVRMISVQRFLGVSRQVFFLRWGGFDTHAKQSKDLVSRLTRINESLRSLRSALQAINMWNDTTVFSLGEFGRTTTGNGDGTDHGWGGNYFVAGGSVRGKRIYGDIPELNMNSNAYTKSRGRLIPTQSTDQYAATLGRWFGLDNGELLSVFPNLANFDRNNLGFLG